MAVFYGVPDDDGISEFNKARFTQSLGGQTVTVTAYMTEECQMSLRAIWESPFEGETVGNATGTVGNLVQVETDRTSKTLLNSAQVWEGSEPPEISFTLKLVAYTNAKLEVNDAITSLLQMMSPELKNKVPADSQSIGGYIPSDVVVKVGKAFSMNMRISEVSFDVNAPKTKDGYYAHNAVTVVAAPKMIINKSQITNHFQ